MFGVDFSCNNSAPLAAAPIFRSSKISLLGLGRSLALKATCRRFYCMYFQIWGHCATSQKVAGLIPDAFIGIFH
jgi:hypothetical protein